MRHDVDPALDGPRWVTLQVLEVSWSSQIGCLVEILEVFWQFHTEWLS